MFPASEEERGIAAGLLPLRETERDRRRKKKWNSVSESSLSSSSASSSRWGERERQAGDQGFIYGVEEFVSEQNLPLCFCRGQGQETVSLSTEKGHTLGCKVKKFIHIS